MELKTFEVILFFGKPASGKSEVIDYLKKVPLEERIKRFHIGNFKELDDFKLLWEKGEEDDILEKLGQKRLYTQRHPTGYLVSNKFLYKILIKELNLLYKKTKFEKDETVFIEFSRGGKDGYRTGLSLVDSEILKKAAIVHVNVSYKETVRKNLRRYSVDEKESILKHSVPEEVMQRYKVDDWDALTKENPDYINIRNIKVPYVDLQNEPEITDKPEILGKELEKILTRLQDLYDKTH